MSNMRTIRVTGKGRLKVRPDTTRITISLEGTWPEYGETLRHSSLQMSSTFLHCKVNSFLHR